MAPNTRISPFRHPWFENWTPDAPKMQPLNHWRIHDMSSAIRAKPEWKRKYKDAEITRKWRQEIREQFADVDIVDKLFDYVLKELEWVENVEAELQGGFSLECDYQIVGSTSAIDQTTRQTLIDQTQKLYDSFGDKLDYHPGSDNKVIDLVHPSLFPLQYGTTVVKSDGDKLSIAEYYDDIRHAKGLSEYSYGLSKKFQWLPSVMTRGDDDEEYKFTSYINNLHPVQFSDLYDTLSTIFNKCLPGLTYMLDRAASPMYYRIPPEIFDELYATNGKTSMWDHMNALEEEHEGDDDFDIDQDWDANAHLYIREIYQEFKEGPEMSGFNIKDFKDLKVITKLANIELSPQDPTYPGGSWHVEGTVNEDIIATIIYYYDSENITESKLSFRTGFGEPSYEQGDNVGTKLVFGLEDGDKLVRPLGAITSETNKCVIWPNLYQHHVEPFELVDKSKPGHRKILCFFICDPYNKCVVGTDQVPYQQKQWWDDPALSMDHAQKQEITKLTKALPMTLQKAMEVRDELMQERSAKMAVEEDDPESEVYGAVFSLCEH